MKQINNMKRMLSGIKPTGGVTLGNYLGAIKPFVGYQDNYEMYIFIADLHALTVYQNPVELKQNTEDLIAIYLAAGLDPKKVCLFKQSDIPEHSQLEWILTCNTQLSELTKMPQYKKWCEVHKNEAVPAGMLLYPSLMNADILLYDADYIPVGIDQKPHVDLTRDIGDRFNKIYGNTFKLPEAILASCGAKIMSLSDPTKKMSKSESDIGTIYLLDSEEIIRKKIKRAITDSECKIYYDPIKKPGISNLLTILSCLSGKSIQELENLYKDETNYGKLKSDVADFVCAEIDKIQAKIKAVKQSNIINDIITEGALKAKIQAENKLLTVYNKIGLK